VGYEDNLKETAGEETLRLRDFQGGYLQFSGPFAG
jgi:hypothetical protein